MIRKTCISVDHNNGPKPASDPSCNHDIQSKMQDARCKTQDPRPKAPFATHKTCKPLRTTTNEQKHAHNNRRCLSRRTTVERCARSLKPKKTRRPQAGKWDCVALPLTHLADLTSLLLHRHTLDSYHTKSTDANPLVPQRYQWSGCWDCPAVRGCYGCR